MSLYALGLGHHAGQITVRPGIGATPGAVPWRRLPVVLRLVDTLAEVLDYAAGGFHVAELRGAAGGASDPAVAWGHAVLTARHPVPLAHPLGRADLGALWQAAREKYLAVYQAAAAAKRFAPALVVLLREANAAADAAYGGEGVEPPRDPHTGETSAPATTEKLPPLAAESEGGGLGTAGGLMLGAGALVGIGVIAASGRRRRH